jgi:hypothetical protein
VGSQQDSVIITFIGSEHEKCKKTQSG